MVNMDARAVSAERIVEIQRLLSGSNLSFTQRETLAEEQRVLWEREHEGRPFDAILHDVWLTKHSTSAPE